MAFSDIILRIGADATTLGPGLRKAEDMTNSFGSRVSSKLKGAFAGALTVGAVTAFVARVAEAASETKDLSERLGTSTKFAQQLAFNFKETGADAEDATAAVEKLDAARRAALADSSGAEAQALNKLGLDQNDLLQTRQGLYEALGRELGKQRRSAAEIDGLTEIFGQRLAGKVLPAAESMAEAFEKASKAGVIISDATISRLDSLTKAKEVLEGKIVAQGANSSAEIDRFLSAFGGAVKQQALGVGGREMAPLETSSIFDEIERFAQNFFENMDDLRRGEDTAAFQARKAAALREAAQRRELEGLQAQGEAKKASEAEKALAALQTSKESEGRDVAGARFRPGSDSLGAIGGMTTGVGFGSLSAQVSEMSRTMGQILTNLKMMRQDVVGVLRD